MVPLNTGRLGWAALVVGRAEEAQGPGAADSLKWVVEAFGIGLLKPLGSSVDLAGTKADELEAA